MLQRARSSPHGGNVALDYRGAAVRIIFTGKLICSISRNNGWGFILHGFINIRLFVRGFDKCISFERR